jgi:hypothetical protein
MQPKSCVMLWSGRRFKKSVKMETKTICFVTDLQEVEVRCVKFTSMSMWPYSCSPDSVHNIDRWIELGTILFDSHQLQVTQIIVLIFMRCKDYFSSNDHIPRPSQSHGYPHWSYELDSHWDKSGWLVASLPTLLLLVTRHNLLVGRILEILNDIHTYTDATSWWIPISLMLLDERWTHILW